MCGKKKESAVAHEGKIKIHLEKDCRYVIAERVADGLLLSEVAEQSDMPDIRTIRRWMRENPKFREEVLAAQAMVAYESAMEARRIARGDAGFSTGDIQRDKLLIETDKWFAERLVPEFNKVVKVEENPNTGVREDIKAVKSFVDECKARGIDHMALVHAIDVTPNQSSE